MIEYRKVRIEPQPQLILNSADMWSIEMPGSDAKALTVESMQSFLMHDVYGNYLNFSAGIGDGYKPVLIDGVWWWMDEKGVKVCDICNKQIAENDDDYHDYHEPECPRYRDFDGESDCDGCYCDGIAHSGCCPGCNEDAMDSILDLSK